MRNIERLAIIDHDNHELFIEDVDMDELEEQYGGEEELYIKDNYDLGENWSWEWITSTAYYSLDNKDGIEVEFSDLVD